MKTWVIGFVLLVAAGQARAQFDECVVPSSVPAQVYSTILDQASFDFGNVAPSVCDAIVAKGVATCKSQVKAAAKCYNRAAAMNYSIAVKQCKQLDLAEDREACKADFKSGRDGINAEVQLDKLDGLSVCEMDFAEELAFSCAVGVI